MSRRLRYASSHSRESSPRDHHSSLPGAQSTVQDVNLSKTTTTTRQHHHQHHHLTVPPSYQASSSHPRQTTYAPADLTAQYLQTGYELSNYSRPSSSERPVNPRHTSAASALAISGPDPVDFHIDPSSLSFNVQPNISDPSLVAPADMSGYTYPSDPMGNSYRSGNSYDQCRSPPMRDFTYSNPENPQRRTSSPSSYGASSNLGSTQYGRAGSISSTQSSYLGGLSASPAAYNGIPYQSGYNIDHVNPQSVCNPSHAPPLPGMLDSAQQGYRGRQPSSASVPSVSPERIKVLETRAKPQCWEHGCNGRQFSTFSNLLRHQREKSGTATKSYCPRCNAEFTRTTARNGHMQHEKCKPRSSEER